MPKKKTEEEFKKDVLERYNNEYTVIGKYIDNKTRIDIRHNCDLCKNNIFSPVPEYFLRKNSPTLCPVCTKNNNPKKKSDSQFKKEIYNLVGDEYQPLEKYKKSNETILMKHNIPECGLEWRITPNDFISGMHRCPSCSKKEGAKTRIRSQEEFEKEIFDKYGSEFLVTGTYLGQKKPVKIQHINSKCNNYEWSIIAASFNGKCPKCSGNAKRTHDEFEKEIYDKFNNEYTVIGQYKGVDHNITILHNTCSSIFNPIAGLFLRNKWHCPRCCNRLNSQGVKKIEEYLNSKNIIFIKEKKFSTCKYKNELPFDFYLPKYKIIIEYDGEGHLLENAYGRTNNEFKLQILRDDIKNNWCFENGFNMIRISYLDLCNIDTILDRFLNNNYELYNFNVYFIIDKFIIKYGEYSKELINDEDDMDTSNN